MRNFLLKYSPVSAHQSVGILIFRVTIAIMMISHGLPKLMGFVEKLDTFRDPLGIGRALSLSGAILGEVIGPVFIILGWYTRIATIPMIFTMAVAGFIVHAPDAYAIKEKALLFMLCGLIILITGPGKYSLDARLNL